MKLNLESILLSIVRTSLTIAIVLAILIVGPGRCARTALHAATTSQNTSAPSSHVDGLAAFDSSTEEWLSTTSNETTSRAQTYGEHSQNQLDKASFVAGDYLPTGFSPLNAQSSEIEAYWIEFDKMMREGSGMRATCIGIPQTLRRQLNLIDDEMDRLYSEGKDSSAFLEAQYKQLKNHHVVIAEFEDPDPVSIKQFNVMRRLAKAQLDDLLEKATKNVSQSLAGKLTQEFGEEVELGFSISDPRILSESSNHITVILGMGANIVTSEEQDNDKSIALLSLVLVEGRMIAVYSYVPEGDTKSLEEMTAWLDETVAKLR